MERIALLVDQIGKGDNIFENFAIEFENAKLKGDVNTSIGLLQQKIEKIERILQDISEKINIYNENDNIYSIIITETRKVLSIWLPVFSKRNIEPKILDYFDKALDKLIDYLDLNTLNSKSVDVIIHDFQTKFSIGTTQVRLLEKEMHNVNLSELSVEWIDKIVESVVRYVAIVHQDINHTAFQIVGLQNNPELAFKVLTNQVSKLQNISSEKQNIEDGEDTIYSINMKLWIDSNDAVEANKFVNLVTQIIGNIENVQILLVDSGKGSYWQNLKIRAKGWFAKEETKQILAKSQKALESYSLDRHIEPIEKSRIERQRQEEDIKRLMPEDQVRELQKIEIAKSKEELEALKLNNLEKRLSIMDKMSSMLANGLVEIDSDYRIEIDGVMLITQINKKIETNTIDNLTLNFEKELLPPSSSEEKNE